MICPFWVFCHEIYLWNNGKRNETNYGALCKGKKIKEEGIHQAADVAGRVQGTTWIGEE